MTTNLPQKSADPVAAIPEPSVSAQDVTRSPIVTRSKPLPDTPQPSKKSRQTMQPRTHTSEPSTSTPSSGILQQFAAHFSGPVPMHDTVFVIIDTSMMEAYFASLRTSLVNVLYPDARFNAAGLINEHDFILVCRYLTKARIDHIYSQVSGRRPPNRIAIPRELQLPQSLATVINGIGTVIVLHGAFNVVPQPEVDPVDPAQRLTTRVTFAMLNSFTRLVLAAAERGYISLSTVSSVTSGTAWWLLNAVDAQTRIIAVESDMVEIRSTFHEWTPCDGLLAAIVQRQFDGALADVNVLLWTFDRVTGIAGLRNSFNLEA